MNKIKKPKGWYQQITIRPTLSVDGYENYEKICSYVADVYFSVDEPTAQQLIRKNDRDSRGISFYTLFKVGQAKCPAYWVGKDLLAALIQSDLTIEADSLNWAMKTGILMLPKNVVMSPENHSVYAILWHYDTDEELIYLITSLNKKRKAIKAYKFRWSIECCFKHLKTKGFDLEDVNVKGELKVMLMVALVSFLYTLCVLQGLIQRVKIKVISTQLYFQKLRILKIY